MALSISSIDISTPIAFRRARNPNVPIANSRPEQKDQVRVEGVAHGGPPSSRRGEEDAADHRDEEQHADDLERQHVPVEEEAGKGRRRAVWIRSLDWPARGSPPPSRAITMARITAEIAALDRLSLEDEARSARSFVWVST